MATFHDLITNADTERRRKVALRQVLTGDLERLNSWLRRSDREPTYQDRVLSNALSQNIAVLDAEIDTLTAEIDMLLREQALDDAAVRLASEFHPFASAPAIRE